MMRTASIPAALLVLALTGCKATHELVESRVAVSVDLETAASVAVFGATGVPGEYRFAGHEGVASRVVKSGGVLGSSAPAPKAPSHAQTSRRPGAAQLSERAAPPRQLRKFH